MALHIWNLGAVLWSLCLLLGLCWEASSSLLAVAKPGPAGPELPEASKDTATILVTPGLGPFSSAAPSLEWEGVSQTAPVTCLQESTNILKWMQNFCIHIVEAIVYPHSSSCQGYELLPPSWADP